MFRERVPYAECPDSCDVDNHLRDVCGMVRDSFEMLCDED